MACTQDERARLNPLSLDEGGGSRLCTRGKWLCGQSGLNGFEAGSVVVNSAQPWDVFVKRQTSQLVSQRRCWMGGLFSGKGASPPVGYSISGVTC